MSRAGHPVPFVVTLALVAALLGCGPTLVRETLDADLMPTLDHPLPGVDLAEAITQATGVSISPLLGVSSMGVWHYYRTPVEGRADLPWFCHPYAWGLGFALLGLCLTKDTVGSSVPLLKKTLDLAELFESKASALIASSAFLPILIASIDESAFTGLASREAIAGRTLYASGIPLGPEALGSLTTAAWVSIAIACFLMIWLASHTINVLVALCPLPVVDTVLKATKLMLLAMVVLSYLIHPGIGLTLCLLLLLLAAGIAGWSYRIARFGTIMAHDFLARKRAASRATPNAPHAFLAKPMGGLPVRTYGRVGLGSEGLLTFTYRRWFVSSCTVALDVETAQISRGLLFPSLLRLEGKESSSCLLFPPRYRGLEPSICTSLGITDVLDTPMLRGLQATKAWLGEVIGLGRTATK